ncbi:MAG: DUF3857 domain-containing protein [Elusimicrobiales bacterium]
MAAVFLLAAQNCGAETLRLRDGSEFEAAVSSIDASAINFSGHPPVARGDAAEIRFSSGEGAAGAAAPVTEQDKKDAAQSFRLARGLAAKYPGVNGLVLLDYGEYTLNPDGTRSFRAHMVRQILKESLLQRWGSVSQCVDDGRERVSILKANVYSPDGQIYTLDPGKIKTTRPQDAGSAFFISGSVCVQYDMPNVQTGSIVDYEILNEEHNPFRKDFFFPFWGFQDGEGPVLRSEAKITVPAGREFFHSARNMPGKSGEPEITETASSRTYRWRLDDVAPLSGEPEMPPYENVAPVVRGSLFKSWDVIFDWANQFYAERTKPSPELERFTLELVKGAKTDGQKAAKIYHYVQKEIRYIALKTGVASGWGGYDANLTWKRRWGCCIDKSLLLTAMLRVAGIKATPLWINTNNMAEIDFDIPQIGFDHSITLAVVDGKKVFLDSTNYDYRYPEVAGFDYGVKVLAFFDKKIDFVPVPAPKDNGSFYDYEIAVSSNGDTAVSETFRYTGAREGALCGHYRRMKREEQKRTFQMMSKSVSPRAELESWTVNNAEDLEKPFSLQMKYIVKDYPQKAGNIRIFKLPDFEIEQFRISEIAQARRKYPIRYDTDMTSMGRYFSYTVSLPPNYEIISLPEKIKMENEFGSFSAQCKKKSGARVVCSASWERPAREIPAEGYVSYKAFVERAAEYTKNQLFFRVK